MSVFAYPVVTVLPLRADTDVPAGINVLPVIGDPDVGADPTQATLNDPFGESNIEAIVLVVPLLATLNVGAPILAPV